MQPLGPHVATLGLRFYDPEGATCCWFFVCQDIMLCHQHLVVGARLVVQWRAAQSLLQEYFSWAASSLCLCYVWQQ